MFRSCCVTTSKLEQTRDGREGRLLVFGWRRGRGMGPLSLQRRVGLLLELAVGLGERLVLKMRLLVPTCLGLVEVVSMLGMLESLAFACAAVYHAGKMHCHGEGRLYGSQQRLRHGREGERTGE